LSFALFYHQFGYGPHREEILNQIINDDLEGAIIKLQEIVVEHDILKQEISDDDTINQENHFLHHALLHSESASIEANQLEATLRALEEEVT
jgi:hypothetical protein